MGGQEGEMQTAGGEQGRVVMRTSLGQHDFNQNDSLLPSSVPRSST